MVAVTVAGMALAVASLAVSENKEEKLPAPAPAQPIQFSHKQHSELGLECGVCHADADSKDQAGLPAVALCMQCHETIKTDSPEIKKLAELQARGEQIRWVRIYKVPAYVFFSHSSHTKAKQKCGTCHGPVEQRHVMAQEVSTSMMACIQCHRALKASTGCFLCHQLGQ
jgi:predicted CXXCH cytochrome family protein